MPIEVHCPNPECARVHLVKNKYAGMRGDGHPPHVGGIDIEKSGITWGVDQDSGLILPGFSQIPGIGLKMALKIVAERMLLEEAVVNPSIPGPIFDWGDLAAIDGIGPVKLGTIKSWSENEDPFGVATLRTKLDVVRKMLRNGELVDMSGRMLPSQTHKSEDIPFDLGVNFHDGGQTTWGSDDRYQVIWLGRVKGRNLRDMFEEHRSREGVDLDPSTVKYPDKKHSMVLFAYDDTDEINLRVNRWKFASMKDNLMKIALDHDLVLVDGWKNRSFGRKIEVERLWRIDPD